MQVDADTLLVQGYDLVKKIEHPAIIDRVGHIETNNM